MEAVSPLVVAAGVVAGVLYGLFGVGSALATPLLALIGVPAPIALTAALPGLFPGAAVGTRRHLRAGSVDRQVAVWTVIGALPTSIAGALLSRLVSGSELLLLSGVMLFAIGVRLLVAQPPTGADVTSSRRTQPARVIGAAAVVGLVAGLLANGGGFLLVPLFLVYLGLDLRAATGTSLAATTVLTIPTTLTHWAAGSISWPVAAAVAVGLVPGAWLGARLAHRIPARHATRTFGVLLLLFSSWFIARTFCG